MGQELEHFNSLVDRFAQLQGWIEKAQALAGQYRPEVVDRVVNGHAHTRDELAVEIVPLTTAIENQLSDAAAEAASATAAAADTNAQIDEINLRHLIGELDDAGLATELSALNKNGNAASARLKAASHTVESLQAALSRWNDLGTASGVLK